MSSDTTEDMRIGSEILKQQAELYRRLRNTLRWALGSLDGFSDDERVDFADMPELERWVLHRLAELDATIRRAVETHEWTGVYPALHAFCSADLSAFYFDVRKDSLYCDRADSPRRRAARTVLDHLHRCLSTWLAPVLCFTAEEAWSARFGEDESVHLQQFPAIPEGWRDPTLAARWEAIRERRRVATTALEEARRDGMIKSSLQAHVTLQFGFDELLDEAGWAETLIVSDVTIAPADTGETRADVEPAAGERCARCWRVLAEVGSEPAHPTLCLRCVAAVS
jgi:isoleucyl-tRNA synthetase